MEGWLIVLVFLAVFAIAMGVGVYLEQRRATAIKALAAGWGFDYQQSLQPHIRKWATSYLDSISAYLPGPVCQFNLFDKGRNRRLSNLIQGQQGDVEIYLADYSFVTGSSKHRRTHHQTIVILQSPHLELPSFLLTPENVFHKMGNLFGHNDIDFDSHPIFSRRYLLRGTDEGAIRDCFQDGVLTFYERQERVCSQGIGSFLLFYRPERPMNPAQWKQLMNTALEAHEQFVQRY